LEERKRLKWLEPDGKFTEVQLRKKLSKTTKSGADLPRDNKGTLPCLMWNVNLFVWTPVDMPEIDPKVSFHKNSIKKYNKIWRMCVDYS
jgi:hypothetical protein